MLIDPIVEEMAKGMLSTPASVDTQPPVVAPKVPSFILYATALLGSVVVKPPAVRYVALSACLRLDPPTPGCI